MTDHDLANLLERSADRIPIGTPPLSEMLVGADRLRRRRTKTRVAVVGRNRRGGRGDRLFAQYGLILISRARHSRRCSMSFASLHGWDIPDA